MVIVQLFAVCALLVGVNSINVVGNGARYPPSSSDVKYNGGPDVSIEINLGNDAIVFNGVSYSIFYLNTNGYVTFGGKYGKQPMPLTHWDAYYQKMIAVYWANTEPRCQGIQYRILKRSGATDEEMAYFNNADSDVMHANVPRMGTFEATTLVVISFLDVKARGSFPQCRTSPGITYQLVLASDNIVSYAFFLYQSLGFDSSSNGQYAIAAIESGGGFTNIVKDVHAVSGTEHVSTLPDQDGNVVEGGVAQKGYFIMDIDSMRNPALLAMKVSEMMAQLEMMMTVVQALPEKPVVNPYTRPAAVQAANPYYPGYAFAQRAYMAGDLNARFQEAYPERPNVPYRYSD